jgi:hypothetical protein
LPGELVERNLDFLPSTATFVVRDMSDHLLPRDNRKLRRVIPLQVPEIEGVVRHGVGHVPFVAR